MSKDEYSVFASYGERAERGERYIVDDLRVVDSYEKFSMRSLKDGFYSNWIIFSFVEISDDNLAEKIKEKFRSANLRNLDQLSANNLTLSITVYSDNQRASVQLGGELAGLMHENMVLEINLYCLTDDDGEDLQIV